VDGRSVTVYFSNTALENVVDTYYQTRIIQMYAWGPTMSSGVATGSGPVSGESLWKYIGGGDYNLQNGMPLCKYSTSQTTGDVATCVNMVPNEWVTFQVGITLGPKGVDSVGRYVFTNSRIRLWIAREGQPSVLVNDFAPGQLGYFQAWAGSSLYDKKFGKLNIFPYLTDKNATQVHPLCQMWVDEVIISTQQIPDPAPTFQPNPTLALGVNTALNLGAFNPVDPVGDPVGQSAAGLPLFSGIRYDANRHQMVLFGGGHVASNDDAIHRFKLSSGQLTWSREYTSTAASERTFSNYDFTRGCWLAGANGPYPRPASRHTECLLVMDGDQLILHNPIEGNYPNLVGDWSAAPHFSEGSVYYAECNGKRAHYSFLSQTWTFSAADTSGPSLGTWPAACKDPVSGLHLVLGTYGLQTYNPTTQVLTDIVRFGSVFGSTFIHDESGTVVDPATLNINQSLIYFPPDDCFYYLGNLGSVFKLAYNRTTPTSSVITKLTTTGTAPPGSAPEVNRGAYDSANHLIGVGPRNNIFYAFDPVTKNWSSKTIPQSPGSCNYHCIDFNPIDNCYIFISAGLSTWAYRYA
jgi:hypothetical protein